jgi:DNA-binding SARP family transcriptional activator
MRRSLLAALPSSVEYIRETFKSVFFNAGGRCALRGEGCVFDVSEFDKTLAEVSIYLQQQDEAVALQELQTIGELYRGKLLPGDYGLEWLDVPRRHYHSRFLDAMTLAAKLCLGREEPEAALFYLHRALALERGREGLYSLAMQAYIQAERPEDAREAFQEYRSYLADELGLCPSADLQHFYETLTGDHTQASE